MLVDVSGDRPAAVVPIPEVREYPRINAEVVRHLDAGEARVVLAGAGGHRLLLHGLAGPWNAVVEVEGHAGPELAAGMNAPGLTVVCRGHVGDGAARDLRAGRVVILGDAGDALAYFQRGGTVLVAGSSGHRAGLNMVGGSLVLLGDVGRLAGERQSGGRIWAVDGRIGPHARRGQVGGQYLRIVPDGDGTSGMEPADADAFSSLIRECSTWLGSYSSEAAIPSWFPSRGPRDHLICPPA